MQNNTFPGCFNQFSFCDLLRFFPLFSLSTIRVVKLSYKRNQVKDKQINDYKWTLTYTRELFKYRYYIMKSEKLSFRYQFVFTFGLYNSFQIRTSRTLSSKLKFNWLSFFVWRKNATDKSFRVFDCFRCFWLTHNQKVNYLVYW